LAQVMMDAVGDSLINRYIPCNMILTDLTFFFLFFLQFCIMRKLGQCGKYIWSLAIPLWTSFPVFSAHISSQHWAIEHRTLVLVVSYEEASIYFGVHCNQCLRDGQGHGRGP
jgi:hypothetical protein